MPGKRLACLSKEELSELKETLLNMPMDSDSKYMTLALIVSDRSKDPSNQVGAVIIGQNGNIVLGYNGAPYGMSDDLFPWDSKGEATGDLMNIKNSFVVHTEQNAILNYLKKAHTYENNMYGLKDATMYVTWYPCNECAKVIAQSGIKKVVYHRMYSKPDVVNVTSKIFECAGIECVPYSEIEIDKKTQYEQRDCSVKRIKYLKNTNKNK